MPLLLDVVIHLSSNVVKTPNGQFLDCAIMAFSEWYGNHQLKVGNYRTL